ncbi:MAG: hypothetical protein A2W29_05430 [Gemmatimonadetes bacterium RBG_16_66_8]|nr:MAG: hypothetical protein A2W29_05430 [Gemmatimonadetes bacterium RBG_16_66_8]
MARAATRNAADTGVLAMTPAESSREEDLRRLLTDAIEVQLAALRAGISFWSEWIEQTSAFVQSATRSLSTINAEDQQAKDVLLELVDAGRASVRSMTEIPRHTATRFIEELDRLEKKKEEAAAAGARAPHKRTAPKASPAKRAMKKGRAAPRPKRAGRAKD